MTTPASTVPPENILLTAKHTHNLTFAQLSQLLHPRNEVSVASLFLSSHPPPTPQEIQILSEALKIPEDILHSHFNPTTSFLGGYATASYPDRGRSAIEMPPREPLIYRLYEIVMNYGAAYKAVLNELFGDGIMSAIAFSTKVEKEVERDEKTGVETQWAVITLRGKWLPYSRF